MSSSSRSVQSENGPRAINCHHGRQAKLKCVTKGSNQGRKFYGCSLWPVDDCGFFSWEEDMGPLVIRDLEDKLREKELTLEKIVAEKLVLEQKLQKLRMKKEICEHEIHILEGKIQRHINGERMALAGLYFSWIVVLGIAWLFYNM